ncbi:MAG TPA: flagellar FlbD family protein [Myxococcales bacterium]|nr:flagellar FlbD family protein [Myxococcales bacterium]
MISLTRLDGSAVVVNEAHILFVERTPDTKLTLTNGTHLLVRDPVEEVISRVVDFRRRIHAEPPPVNAASTAAKEA